MSDPYNIGARVMIWGRPNTDMILLFGEGTYEGVTFVNGNYWPTVRLDNGREITVHQQGVSIGKAEQVALTCQKFGGDVVQWDLDAFLRGERPTVDQRVKSAVASGALPPPKSATDKVMYLKREIDLEENKKKLAQQMIENSDKVIAAKKLEIQQLTNSVLNELAAVNPDIIRLVTEQVAAQMAAAQKVVDVSTPSPVVVTKRDLVTFDAPDEDHTKLATED